MYDLKYHVVWIPKYRKLILKGCVAEGLKEIFEGIAERYEMEIDTLEVMPDHVHLFLMAPTEVQSESSCIDIEECIGAGGISSLSMVEEEAVGRGVVG